MGEEVDLDLVVAEKRQRTPRTLGAEFASLSSINQDIFGDDDDFDDESKQKGKKRKTHGDEEAPGSAKRTAKGPAASGLGSKHANDQSVPNSEQQPASDPTVPVIDERPASGSEMPGHESVSGGGDGRDDGPTDRSRSREKPQAKEANVSRNLAESDFANNPLTYGPYFANNFNQTNDNDAFSSVKFDMSGNSNFHDFWSSGAAIKTTMQEEQYILERIASTTHSINTRNLLALESHQLFARPFVDDQRVSCDIHTKQQMMLVSRWPRSAYEGVQECIGKLLEIPQPPEKSHESNPKLPVNLSVLDDGIEDFTIVESDNPNAQASFEKAWRKGVPIVYRMDLDLKADWSPNYFIRNFGEEEATFENCKTGVRSPGPVGMFFQGFGSERDRIKGSDEQDVILKLPDWPTNEDFRTRFPAHFEDFARNLPFQNYTARNGTRNLAARLPNNVVPPDLGPKLYCAYGSTDSGKSACGTTPLHLDMADAVNFMVYASTPADSNHKPRRPAALWDIFPRSALPKVREFVGEILRERGMPFDDPIHDQTFFMTTDMYERLHREKGVKVWRILQCVGDAVFVPAGCIHQVCNYVDCIKIACDFVSPESVAYCSILTQEFRKLGTKHSRKHDLLQLQAILWSTVMTSPLLKKERAESDDQNDTGNDVTTAMDVETASKESHQNGVSDLTGSSTAAMDTESVPKNPDLDGANDLSISSTTAMDTEPGQKEPNVSGVIFSADSANDAVAAELNA
ncbi:hypothetical protein HDU96_006420 [Phlyctochytrium bullatum]|nr:hypothetical protein HDU96_006420 [Phlyctochytrium bullatum]